MNNKDLLDFKLLNSRNILNILDGDTKFEGGTIFMPYLSTSEIDSISNMFGLSNNSNGRTMNTSRWEKLKNTIDYCISENKIINLLLYLFSKEQFEKKIKIDSFENLDNLYIKNKEYIIKEINKELRYSGKKLIGCRNTYKINKLEEKNRSQNRNSVYE